MSFLLSRSVISSAILGGGGSTPPELHITGDNGYTDLSSNSYSVAATGATITGTIYNGHKALSCDGVNDYFQANGAAVIFNGSSYDAYIVCKHFVTESFKLCMNWTLFSDNDAYSYIVNRYSDISDGTELNIRDTSNGSQKLSDAVDVGAVMIIINIRVDGTDFEYSTNGGTPVAGTITNKRNDHDTLSFGALVRSANPSGTVFGRYDFAEVQLFDSILEAGERTTLIADLTTKYAL